MYGGSGLDDVQNLNSEPLRGTIYHEIQWMEGLGGPASNEAMGGSGPAKQGPEARWLAGWLAG